MKDEIPDGGTKRFCKEAPIPNFRLPDTYRENYNLMEECH